MAFMTKKSRYPRLVVAIVVVGGGVEVAGVVAGTVAGVVDDVVVEVVVAVGRDLGLRLESGRMINGKRPSSSNVFQFLVH